MLDDAPHAVITQPGCTAASAADRPGGRDRVSGEPLSPGRV